MPRTRQHQLLVDMLLRVPREKATPEKCENCEQRANLLEEIWFLVKQRYGRKKISALMMQLEIRWLDYALDGLTGLKETVKILLKENLTFDVFQEKVLIWCQDWNDETDRLYRECWEAMERAEAAQARAEAAETELKRVKEILKQQTSVPMVTDAETRQAKTPLVKRGLFSQSHRKRRREDETAEPRKAARTAALLKRHISF